MGGKEAAAGVESRLTFPGRTELVCPASARARWGIAGVGVELLLKVSAFGGIGCSREEWKKRYQPMLRVRQMRMRMNRLMMRTLRSYGTRLS